MCDQDERVEGRRQTHGARASGLNWRLALVVLAVACGDEPKTDDGVVSDPPVNTTGAEPSRVGPVFPRASATPDASEDQGPVSAADSSACLATRTPITNPDAALLDVVERLAGSYPIAGNWGAPPPLQASVNEAPFAGELVVSRRDGALVRLGTCRSGTEVPVDVSIRTDDGALAEAVKGTVLIENLADSVTVDGSSPPFRAKLSASLDLGALSGSFTVDDDPKWTFHDAMLRADLTSFGTRGMLTAYVDPRVEGSGPREVSALAPLPLMTWDGGDGCSDRSGPEPAPALFPAQTEARAALDAALEASSAETYSAKYADGTETRVVLEFEPLTLLCALDSSSWAGSWQFPTRVHLRTDDGRLDVSLGVLIDPSFAFLSYYSRTDVPWAYSPSGIAEKIGHIDASMSEYGRVGIQSSFTLTPEPTGSLEVVGYEESACVDCDESGGCSACAFDRRSEILGLSIGDRHDAL